MKFENRYTVVLISGKQGSGKTSLAQGLQKKLLDANYAVGNLKFAMPLYKMHKAIRDILKEDGMDTEVIHKMSGSYTAPFEGIDGPLLQLLGTEWGRKTRGENFWVKYAQETVDRILNTMLEANTNLEPHPVFIFDDCRFPNELSAFHDAVTIRLEAPEEMRRDRAEKWRDNTEHPSETALDGALFDLMQHTGGGATKESTLVTVFDYVVTRIAKKRLLTNESEARSCPQPR